MELLIKSLLEAINYEPTAKTYALRIFSGGSWAEDEKKYNLCDSRLYICTSEYTFDDVWPGFCPHADVMFNESLAERIIRDFNERRKESEALLVSCMRGKNRSPAVAIALNEIFSLGHDNVELKKKYKEANWYVYNTIKDVANRITL